MIRQRKATSVNMRWANQQLAWSSAVPLGQTVIIVADMLRAAEEFPNHLVVLLNASPPRVLSVSHCCHATKPGQDA